MYIISSPALIILFVRLPEKEGVRRMYRSQSNKMISQSSGSGRSAGALVSSLEEDGDAVVEDLAERFAAMVLLAFVFTAAVFFFAFLTSFSLLQFEVVASFSAAHFAIFEISPQVSIEYFGIFINWNIARAA